ncbi:undecaprenyl diphosphate synthase family protein [Nanoarchaeota archaeon]
MKPKHLAFTTDGLKEDLVKSFQLISQLVDEQIKNNLPVLTFYITHKRNPDAEILSAFTKLLSSEEFMSKINSNKVKITALGKWYNLPQQTLDAVKKVIDETKDYDHYFLNFCLNYDGQEEIVDSCKLIIKQIFANKISESAVNEEVVKENLYTSYFIPPDLIIKSGEQKLTSFLLWDSVGASIYFTQRPFSQFTLEELNLILQ